MKRLKIYIYLIVFGLWMNTVHASEKDCVIAEQYYNKASLLVEKENLGKEKLKEARMWLSKSTNICDNFANWYLLGQVDKKLNANALAGRAYTNARQFTSDDNEIALAVARFAEILSANGSYSQALKLLHTARKMHKNPPRWMTDLAKELDSKRVKQQLTRGYVAEALNNRSIELFDLDEQPSLDLSINFKFNSTEIVEKSKQSVNVLAEALSLDVPEKRLINVIGHADEQGSAMYNKTLSIQRAKAIIDQLVSLQPKLRGRLIPLGVGESQPLYSGTSEEIYLLNRRIEIALK